MIDIPKEQSSVVGKGNVPVKKLSKEDMGWFQHHTSHSTKQIGVELWIIIETFFCNQLILIRPSYNSVPSEEEMHGKFYKDYPRGGIYRQ